MKHSDSIYKTHNISIRKAIREIDQIGQQENDKDNQKQNSSKRDINLLVVGGKKAGKTALLRTMAFALTGSQHLTLEKQELNNSIYQKIEIKAQNRKTVVGLQTKQTDKKMAIYGYELITKQNTEYYERALEFIGEKGICCSGRQNKAEVSMCLICVSMIDKLERKQWEFMKFFIRSLEQMSVKYTIIGTKIDCILTEFSEIEKQELEYVDSWCALVASEIQLKNRESIVCLQNYGEVMENSEVINYYALTLLHRCIKERDKPRVKEKRFWLCF